MPPKPKMTMQTRMVLAEFLKNPDDELYGSQIKKAIGIAPGTLYPILRRLENAGWLTGRWQMPPAGQAGRTWRFYQLTSEGWAVARQEAALARSRM